MYSSFVGSDYSNIKGNSFGVLAIILSKINLRVDYLSSNSSKII